MNAQPRDWAATQKTAVALADRGLSVFRLRRGTKNHFFDTDWAEGGATNESIDARLMFSGSPYNIGVLATGYAILDIDCKGGANGFEALKSFPLLPTTFTVRTPSGGLHIYFDAGGERYGQHDLAPGINVRATNGYVVGPGSEYNGGLYEIDSDAPIAPLPTWLAERLRLAAVKDTDAGKVRGDLDTDIAIESAIGYLTHGAPPAIQGCGGDNTTIAVANRVMDKGISEATCHELLLEHWNNRCQPPWEPDNLLIKVENARRYRLKAVGCDNPDDGFEPAAPVTEGSLKTLLEYANEVTLDGLLADAANEIVKRLLGPGECGTIYGESGVGKSHVMLDLSYHVALGLDYHGRKTRRVPVLYVLLEGVRGFRKRIYAMAKEYGDPGPYFSRLKVPVSLTKNEEGKKGAELIIQAVEHMKAETGADTALVVIDTKARAIAGDNENDASDAAAFAERRVGAITRATGAFVMVVHHPNKAGDIRGSTVTKAADDVVLHVEKGRVKAEKIKDDEPGPLFNFSLEQVHLGVDADGVAATTCVVRKSEATRAKVDAPSGPKEPKHIQIYRAAFTAVSALSAKARFTHPKTGEVLDAVLSSEVAEEFLARHPSDKIDTRKRKLREAQRFLPSGLETYTIDGEQIVWLSQGW